MNIQNMDKIALKYKGRHLSPVKSIKVYCKEMCCAGDTVSWSNCSFKSCFLYRYRLGHRDSDSHKINRVNKAILKKNKDFNSNVPKNKDTCNLKGENS